VKTCSTCKFYEWDMTCHRYPPAAHPTLPYTVWPFIQVAEEMGCGEHQPIVAGD
jgi:hypothetical protein